MVLFVALSEVFSLRALFFLKKLKYLVTK